MNKPKALQTLHKQGAAMFGSKSKTKVKTDQKKIADMAGIVAKAFFKSFYILWHQKIYLAPQKF